MDILHLAKALSMAKELPIYLRIPLVLTAWGIGLFSFVRGVEAVIEFFGF